MMQLHWLPVCAEHRVQSVLTLRVTALCSEGDCPMFRRFYVQKVLCSENICSKGSMFRRSYIQKVLCSEGPMFRKTLFKRSYIQKVLCSEGPLFRYIQKVLYSENSLFYVGKNFQFQVNYNRPTR